VHQASETVGPIVRNLPEESWEKGIGPGIVDKKIMGPNDSNFMLMGLAKMEPGVKSPPHRHRYTQVFYFVEGKGQVVVDGQAHDVGPGSVARFVHGEEHTVINPGPGALTLIEVRVLPRGQTVWE
jgi:mannose-6-phosphate isomerase-like protein (cupin superfamily)